MIKIKYVCDKCGREIEGCLYYTVTCAVMPDNSGVSATVDIPNPTTHYHSECYTER